jgi:hypothetical protein
VSAAEKLKALEEALQPAPWPTQHNAMVVREFASVATIRNALPELIAVVEAAKYLSERTAFESPVGISGEKELSVALAALDAKLGEQA